MVYSHILQPHLRDLMTRRHNPVLQKLLFKAYDVIRTAMYSLPRETRDDHPRLTRLVDIVFQKQGRKRCVPLDRAVNCLCKLGGSLQVRALLYSGAETESLVRSD